MLHGHRDAKHDASLVKPASAICLHSLLRRSLCDHILDTALTHPVSSSGFRIDHRATVNTRLSCGRKALITVFTRVQVAPKQKTHPNFCLDFLV